MFLGGAHGGQVLVCVCVCVCVCVYACVWLQWAFLQLLSAEQLGRQRISLRLSNSRSARVQELLCTFDILIACEDV